ncbi:hypothetical protein M272_08550 [Vibrio natriegens NBRC 15636 = ATCC 14048 = DSM 759]|uniref:Uncharacterized protein n=2 Tax=Vibrio natriegens TaxID=691 RepID=A0AAN1CWY0_VIBNA|nr:hypothetical protein BA890_15005 [Vibrio natriegens NBRC 15636 = ATCC 14048 = DSM 759]EPM41609.1 hypothetical protein M272_08550 [Vibrio natriegens NBRC 15636 = ATCC 14048 = DSM 759]
MSDFILRLWNNALTPWVYSTTIFILVVILLIKTQVPDFHFSTKPEFNRLNCGQVLGDDNFEQNINLPTFTILGYDLLARPILTNLCQEPKLMEDFGDIEYRWINVNDLSPQDIYQQKVDLMWSRDYFLAGLTPDYKHYYREIVSMPSYDIFWFSHEALPVDDIDSFFTTHRVGLLSNNFSRSAYQAPLEWLKSRQINIESVEIKYYPTRQAFRQALLEKEVDIVADSNHSPLLDQIPLLSQTLIVSNQSAGGWYLRSDLVETLPLALIKDKIMTVFTLKAKEHQL